MIDTEDTTTDEESSSVAVEVVCADARRERFDITFPPPNGLVRRQDEEWCELELDGTHRKLRFHDYNEIYRIPGLYEHLFYDRLECDSPRTVCAMVAEELRWRDESVHDLKILDVGAGNGMVGEELQAMGADKIVGVDIIGEAAEACHRDRPGVYDDYVVADLTDLPADDARKLVEQRFNCLVTVAALGFGDIPPEAFANAYSLVEPGGLIVFNIKEEFLDEGDGSGFARLIDEAITDGTMVVKSQKTYRHRFSSVGEPLLYAAVVARKREEMEDV